MKTVQRRGMRDMRTIQTLANQSVVVTRPQAVSRFARLESERSRLERELGTWAARQEVAERMLAKVREELAVLQQFLLQPSSPSASARRRRFPGSRERRGEPAEMADRGEILIDY